MPGAACRRLYSLPSIRRTTSATTCGIEAARHDASSASRLFRRRRSTIAIEHVVRRQRVLVGLVGPQLGARRLGERRRRESRPACRVDVARQSIDQRLRHVADHGQPAAHVAVQRAVADRELALVAGGEQQAPGLVRQRHQRRAADARLQVLLGGIRRSPIGRAARRSPQEPSVSRYAGTSARSGSPWYSMPRRAPAPRRPRG